MIDFLRSRYPSPSRVVSKTKPDSKYQAQEMYEYYKREGSIMKDKYEKDEISRKEFDKWIDSTKIRK